MEEKQRNRSYKSRFVNNNDYDYNKIDSIQIADIEERTQELIEENYAAEPDISTDCEVFDKSELIEEETVVIVPDSDPNIEVYITSETWVNQFLFEPEGRVTTRVSQRNCAMLGLSYTTL